MRAAATAITVTLLAVAFACGPAAAVHTAGRQSRSTTTRLAAVPFPADVPGETRTEASEQSELPVAAAPGSRTGVQAYGDPVYGTPLRVLVVGASVSEGWFASSPDHTYSALVAHGLEATGRRVRLRLIARPGVTAGEADTWDLSGRSDVVIVQLATNDYVRGVPLPVFAASYEDVLHRLRIASPTAEMVCTGGWDDPTARNLAGVEAVDYDAAARAACGAVGGRYVDLSAIYLDQRNHGPDGRSTFHGAGDVFHPNDRGHEELAQLILSAVAEPGALVQPGPGVAPR